MRTGGLTMVEMMPRKTLSAPQLAAERARFAAEALAQLLGITETNYPKIGIILGTGWGGALQWKGEKRISFKAVPGFEKLGQLEGHAREVVFGEIEGQSVIALSGRVHLNEAPYDVGIAEMVRLQVEMLIKLGVETLILTAAAGSLREEIKVGNIVVVDGFVTLFAPGMPLYAGEFCSPEDTLHAHLREQALDAVSEAGSEPKTGGYAMLLGPWFEGRRYDKALLRVSGASTVGMSMLPEACTAALYPQIGVIPLNFITNTASEEHSHGTNQQRAREKSGNMAAVLHGLVAKLRK